MRSPVFFRGRRLLNYRGHYYPNEETTAYEVMHEALQNSVRTQDKLTRILLVPNGSYRICSRATAAAYAQLCPDDIKRIFIIGRTSHFLPYMGAVSTMDYLNTPLGILPVDQEVNLELLKTGDFSYLDIPTDNKEKYVEMQLPFVSKVMETQKGLFKVVPIYIGTLAYDQQSILAKRFQTYLADPSNAFVFSVSLCHWGQIYGYNTKLSDTANVLESIKATDALAIEAMKSLSFKNFDNFLMDTKATVFDNQIISLCINMVQQFLTNEMFGLIKLEEERASSALKTVAKFKLVGQAWSFPDVTEEDSCISFFSAVVTLDKAAFLQEEPQESNQLNKAT